MKKMKNSHSINSKISSENNLLLKANKLSTILLSINNIPIHTTLSTISQTKILSNLTMMKTNLPKNPTNSKLTPSQTQHTNPPNNKNQDKKK
jgi:DNA-directed RNA polymerase subunit H (RpoH/RPB5)